MCDQLITMKQKRTFLKIIDAIALLCECELKTMLMIREKPRKFPNVYLLSPVKQYQKSPTPGVK